MIAVSGSGNIVDSDGNDVDSSLHYKLVMADGSELGMTSPDVFTWYADQSPSNGGAIIEWSKELNGHNSGDKWADGAFVYLRGAYALNGKLRQKHLYTFKFLCGKKTYVGWTDHASKATRFRATNVAGNRIALFAEEGGVTKGIRLNRFDEGSRKDLTLQVDQSDLKLSLSCQLVRVQSLEGWIKPPK